MKHAELFQRLLAELFQLDQADLDFGVYRIMNQRRDEVIRFLETELLPQVQEELGRRPGRDEHAGGDSGENSNHASIGVEKVVNSEHAACEEINREEIDREEINRESPESIPDPDAVGESVEAQVFTHLYNFFRRYYDQGDFISQRRYKRGAYAIPYEGEEVTFHWANHDQIYVKSSERLQRYAFTVPSGKRVTMRLVGASTPRADGQGEHPRRRRYVLEAVNPISVQNGELQIRFEYRQGAERRSQESLNRDAAERIFQAEQLGEWMEVLATPAPTEGNPKRTLLERHMSQFMARRSHDCFIHKDLGGFLRRELDYFVATDVMNLDDFEHGGTRCIEHSLRTIRVVRRVAHKIIRFLEQSENWQKKLWLKKKFVLETSYLLPLARVPAELYTEVAENNAQRDEWVALFSIDRIKNDGVRPGYSEPLTVEFLEQHKHLVVDTRHFGSAFVDRLRASFAPGSESEMSLLVRSDNFHALNLLERRFQGEVSCIYIDPPYNTGSDGFVYKDNYRHSTWASMMADRLAMLRGLCHRKGAILTSIDEGEQPHLRMLLNAIWGKENFVAEMVWAAGRKNDSRLISVSHEYILVYARDRSLLSAEQVEWRQRKKGLDEIYAQHRRLRRKHGDDYAAMTAELKKWYKSLPESHPSKAHSHFSHVDEQGVFFPDNISWPGGGGPRFEVKHPVTNAAVKVPSRGWMTSDPAKMQQWIQDGRVHFGPDEHSVPCIKSYLADKEYQTPYSVFYRDGRAATKRLRNVLGFDAFGFPKDETVVADCVEMVGTTRGVVLDAFAGSGTTAQSVIDLNRKDSGNRRFILIEQGEHFDTTLLPRVCKHLYSDTWKDGRPQAHDRGHSQIVKVLRLESFDDALDSLSLHRSARQASVLEQRKDLREDYFLNYLFDWESRHGNTTLNLAEFRRPMEYQLVVEGGGGKRTLDVDLVETFNWLLGLNVNRFEVSDGIRVEGVTPSGQRILILWRDLDEIDNVALEGWFIRHGYLDSLDARDVVYVNGDCNLERLHGGEESWSVRLIEEEFQRLMFDDVEA